jgi:hypothetical protein
MANSRYSGKNVILEILKKSGNMIIQQHFYFKTAYNKKSTRKL